jgi:hypothetical protein
METDAEAARRLTAILDARSAKKGKRPVPRENAASTGNQPAGGDGRDRAAGGDSSGLGLGDGQPGLQGIPGFSFEGASDAGCPDKDEITGGEDREARKATLLVFVRMRLPPLDARPGEDVCPRLPRPVACNDDGPGHATSLAAMAFRQDQQ